MNSVFMAPTCDSLHRITDQLCSARDESCSNPLAFRRLCIAARCLYWGVRITMRVQLPLSSVVRGARTRGLSKDEHARLAACHNEIREAIADIEEACPFPFVLKIPLLPLKRAATTLGTYFEEVAMLEVAETILAKLEGYQITPEGERVLTNAA